MLRELVEDIALVLVPVTAPEEAVFLRGCIEVHPGVVAGGQVIVAQEQGTLQQGAELQTAVAVDAGVGGAPGAVFGDKAVHDIPGKALRLIENIEFHAQTVGNAAGIGGIVGRAAGALRLSAVQAQHGPVACIALLPEQEGGGGAVYPAGHGH